MDSPSGGGGLPQLVPWLRKVQAGTELRLESLLVEQGSFKPNLLSEWRKGKLTHVMFKILGIAKYEAKSANKERPLPPTICIIIWTAMSEYWLM